MGDNKIIKTLSELEEEYQVEPTTNSLDEIKDLVNNLQDGEMLIIEVGDQNE